MVKNIEKEQSDVKGRDHYRIRQKLGALQARNFTTEK